MSKKVLISGGKGLIGKSVSKMLLQKGYEVAILSRSPNEENQIPEFYWNTDTFEIDPKAAEYAQNIIHLAGENIGSKRWTERRKKEIIDSRVMGTKLIAKLLTEQNCVPEVFISASATGFYGSLTTDKIFTESDDAGEDFTGKTCRLWEQSVDEHIKATRIVKLRTAVVLAKNGGAMEKFSLPATFGIYPIIGGNQFFPWIHIDDMAAMYVFSLENPLYGVYNAVAPQHLRFREFISFFKGQSFGIKIPVPSFLLKIMLGEMSLIVLEGSRISSDKIRKAGFEFRYPLINSVF